MLGRFVDTEVCGVMKTLLRIDIDSHFSGLLE